MTNYYTLWQTTWNKELSMAKKKREHWRFIQEYGRRYQISDRYRVRNAKQHVLSQHRNTNGCARVTLYVNGKRYIHSVMKLMKKTFM
jgi:hypothetical protein